jgi:hypothetical protein
MRKLLLLLLLVSGAHGQDLTSMYDQQVQQQNAYYQRLTQTMVQQNMDNPLLQQDYAHYRQQGGQATFAQFCYLYAATGGMTDGGIARYQQNEANIAAQQQQAWSQYQQAQARRSQVHNQYAQGYHLNQQEAGYNLRGQATYQGNQQLPYSWQSGTYNYNNSTYYVDPSGQYYEVDPHGWGTPINQR